MFVVCVHMCTCVCVYLVPIITLPSPYLHKHELPPLHNALLFSYASKSLKACPNKGSHRRIFVLVDGERQGLQGGPTLSNKGKCTSEGCTTTAGQGCSCIASRPAIKGGTRRQGHRCMSMYLFKIYPVDYHPNKYGTLSNPVTVAIETQWDI